MFIWLALIGENVIRLKPFWSVDRDAELSQIFYLPAYDI